MEQKKNTKSSETDIWSNLNAWTEHVYVYSIYICIKRFHFLSLIKLSLRLGGTETSNSSTLDFWCKALNLNFLQLLCRHTLVYLKFDEFRWLISSANTFLKLSPSFKAQYTHQGSRMISYSPPPFLHRKTRVQCQLLQNWLASPNPVSQALIISSFEDYFFLPLNKSIQEFGKGLW